MDKCVVCLVLSWLLKNIEGTENPRQFGKALIDKSDVGGMNLKNKWRYRVGDVRVICDIDDEIVRVLVIKIDHRRKVYK